ncbi:MAG TPA: hypothetical protein PKW07_11595 [Syntrophorhabdaceae bacterium]|nr:hypothetical protein [Syntrophorhabdaceae bacterium]
MSTLIEDTIAIEKEANSILEHARMEAKQIEKECESKIDIYRREKMAEMNKMIAEFEKKAEEDYKKSLFQYEDELKETINRIENIPDDILNRQIELILARLQGA